ncbi:RNA polymerase sigma factor SigL [Micromonospora qiuiae]|uniref:RNA polymerase sigma factor SigL n=1 Tax=Micromonospora qiuiae TaxID=502268 RepID=A0ABQ4J893_9ACTN|nr:sigma-70 family RNA polymerase sigma factor [Micromonospora qiuiae]GIJ26385.1 RNA polymerase sigma factor SigL [Micromonospora qiuiae]
MTFIDGERKSPQSLTDDDRPADDVLATSRMRALHADYAEDLHRFLLRLSWGDRHLADDLLQETMLQAWRHLDKLPAEREASRRWLFVVARRIAIDAARARQARPVEIGTSDLTRLAGGVDTTEDVVAEQTIRRALPKLTPAHRAVLVELYFLGRSTEEAAARLGIPEGTVKSRAFYALRSLRAAVGRIDEG